MLRTFDRGKIQLGYWKGRIRKAVAITPVGVGWLDSRYFAGEHG